MTQRTTTVCDRCAFEENADVGDWWKLQLRSANGVTQPFIGAGTGNVDLCPACAGGFKEWWKPTPKRKA